MKELVFKMQEHYESMRKDDKVQKLYRYFRNKKYLVLFLKQYCGLISNMKSISLLTDAGNVEDSFTIFRKYLETYFIMMSIIEHPDLVEDYIQHDFYIGMKVCKKDRDKIRSFCEGKPDGFLEYGYLEKYVEIDDDFRYTSKTVAEIANVSNFHYWYKMCNNFVHNNLTSVNVDLGDGKETVIQACKKTIDYMCNKINQIILWLYDMYLYKYNLNTINDKKMEF